MEQYLVTPIGVIRSDEEGFRIVLDKEYAPALTGLEGFSHLQILWWFDRCDTPKARSVLEVDTPYKHAPGLRGVFATRSPMRPNPIALTCAEITFLDGEKGAVGIAYTDAEDGSPVLDLKPYTPSLDRVEFPKTPSWCAHWPGSLEASGDFDWEAEFSK